jgi:hypothetical protein
VGVKVPETTDRRQWPDGFVARRAASALLADFYDARIRVARDVL